jgi:hypothetical protein
MALDTFVPGFPEMDDWRTAPEPPFRLHAFGSYRDPDPWCTVYVELKDSAGTVYRFFFDRFLGRLCYGWSDEGDDSAFIRKGSKFESEAFSAIESAAAGSAAANDPEYSRISESLVYARRWTRPG